MLAEPPSRFASRAACRRPLDAALSRLLRSAGIVPPSHRQRAVADAGRTDRIRRVQDYVALHVGEITGLDELADVAGLSRYHFARVFREEVGVAPWRFVRQARTRRALDLLRSGRSPAEAAQEAGFADQSHLTRTLRTLDGRTPGRVARGATRDESGIALENSKDVQDA